MSAHVSIAGTVRLIAGVLAIGALLACSLWVLHPFWVASLWAVLLAVSTWPVLLGLQRHLGGSRHAASAIMTVVLLIFFLVPFVFGLAQILQNMQRVLALVRSLDGLELPTAPAWLAALPVIGEPLGAAWNDAVQLGSRELAVKVAPFAGNIARWLLSELGGLSYVLVQGLVTIGLCALLYTQGEAAVGQAFAAGRRLGGPQGERLVRLAGQAIRGVALGVGMTALAQSLLACVGLAVSGIPYTPLLTAVTFVACVAQIGPLVVLVPAAVWLYWQGQPGWAVALLAWSAMIATMDNVMRPLLIRRGAGNLPLLVIFAGVIGGLLTFGLVGLFVGPVCLAVTWTLLEAWLHEPADPAADG